jgi:AcrR family transcriptional regulator
MEAERTSKSKILDAAASVLSEEGVPSLTMERVAERAGVSKGTVFYHFASKDELVLAMVDMIGDEFDRAICARVESGMSFPEAYVETLFEQRAGPKNLVPVIVGMLGMDPKLRQGFREKHRIWRNDMREAGVSEGAVHLIMLISDGMFVSSALGLFDLDPAAERALKRQLLYALRPTDDEQLAWQLGAALRKLEASETDA